MQKERRGEPSLTVRYPHCAGIDLGKKEIYVAVATLEPASLAS